MKLVSGKYMAQIDKYTINNIGIPGAVLMENAGKGVFNEFINFFNPSIESNILIICGKGNNGGDGFVVARYLTNNNFKNVKIILLTNSEKLKGDALINYNICKNIGIDIEETTSFEKFKKIIEKGKFNFIFDAILGTGLNSEVRDFYKNIIETINNLEAKIISVDIPSGLHSEKGIPLGTCIKAHLTCTFAYKKIGLSTYPGCLYSGEVKVVDISIPDNIPFQFNYFEIDNLLIKNILKERKVYAHKGNFGHALIAGGSAGFTGAALLAARSALRTGCGLVTIIARKELNNVFETAFLEGMTYIVDFENYDRDEVINFINKKSAILIGPGMGLSVEAKNFFKDIILDLEIPVVIDADGLNILSENMEILNEIKIPVVLTPHPGEMSRLINKSTKEIQNNRINYAREFSDTYNVTVILKGYRSIIASNGKIYISPKGTSAIATGGSGDVLAGMVVSFLAQGYSCEQSAVLSTYFHGLAGEIAEERKCNYSVIASDIIDNLHYAFKVFGSFQI